MLQNSVEMNGTGNDIKFSNFASNTTVIGAEIDCMAVNSQ